MSEKSQESQFASEQIETNTCPICQQVNVVDAKICEACGVEVEKSKPKSETEITEENIQLDEELKTEHEKKLVGTTQEFYDWLGVGYNLSKEYQNQKILFLSAEQQQEAEKLGYTFSLIIPCNISREEISEKVAIKFSEELGVKEILTYIGCAKDDIFRSVAAKNPNRSKKPYQIITKSKPEASLAAPETQGKTVFKCLDIIDDLNQQNSFLNFRGFDLSEYLLYQAFFYYQNKEPKLDFYSYHADTLSHSWLLQEIILENDYAKRTGDFKRCLFGNWYGVYHLYISSANVSTSHPDLYGRFLITSQPK